MERVPTEKKKYFIDGRKSTQKRRPKKKIIFFLLFVSIQITSRLSIEKKKISSCCSFIESRQIIWYFITFIFIRSFCLNFSPFFIHTILKYNIKMKIKKKFSHFIYLHAFYLIFKYHRNNQSQIIIEQMRFMDNAARS